MEIDEKEVTDRKSVLMDEITRLENQLQQAQQVMQQAPLMIASRRGELAGLERLLTPKLTEKHKKLKEAEESIREGDRRSNTK